MHSRYHCRRDHAILFEEPGESAHLCSSVIIMWSCMSGGLPEVVLSFKFRRNRLNGLGDTGGLISPFPIPKASGLYNSLYYRTSRDY